MSTILPITEARAALPKIVQAVNELYERYIITQKGKPAAVVMSYAEFESWQETLDIVSNPQLMTALAQAEEDLAAGRVHTYEEVFGHPQPEAA
jgi:antitoxin YefM